MRPPLRSGIAAGLLSWEVISPSIAAALRPLVRWFPGRIEATGARNGTPRYLRCFNDGAEPAWFIKIVDNEELSAARLEADLARTLAGERIVTPRFAAEFALDGGMNALAFHWMQGDHPKAGEVDFLHLGAQLDQLHRALADVADRFSIGERTTNRLAELESLARSNCFSQRWQGCEFEKFALEMRDFFLMHLGRMIWTTGAIHGDLNPGNIMLHGNAFAFLDFEDALHSRLWPGLDLAKIAERLILPGIDVNGGKLAAADFLALRRGYGSDARLAGGPSIPDALRWHIGLSVLIITREFPAESVTARNELNKFNRLADLLKAHGHLFE